MIAPVLDENREGKGREGQNRESRRGQEPDSFKPVWDPQYSYPSFPVVARALALVPMTLAVVPMAFSALTSSTLAFATLPP